MPFTQLKNEITWFFGALCLTTLFCIVLRLPLWASLACLLASASAYTVWTLFRIHRMLVWLRSGAPISQAPQTAGLTTDLISLVHRERKSKSKQQERYRALLTQFNSLAADLPDATIVLDRDFEIRWANAAAARLLNIHRERDQGQRIDNLIRDPEFRNFLHHAAYSEELEFDSPGFEGRILSLRKVSTENDMLMLIAADITQRAQVREMRKAFVADVSHELRTPLTVIHGYMEMLADNQNMDDQSRQALRQVEAQSDRMRGLIEDLLELSKLEANPLPESEGDIIDVSQLVQTLAEPLSRSAPEHKLQLELDHSIGLLGSEREIYSVCNNLLTNAVRYTGPGTRVVASWQRSDDGTAVYQVSDDGPGIEPRHLPRLSERFYRVDAGRSREQGGTGLGLAIVKHAVQRHGGVLEIDSKPGKGSVFGARFPVNRVLATVRTADIRVG